MEDTVEHKSPRSRFTIERVLLAAVLILQVGILLLLTSRSPSPARSEPGDRAATHSPHASRRTLFDESAPGQVRPRPEEARFTLASWSRRIMEQKERMYERSVGDLDEVGRHVSLDDGWDRLIAMPAFDVRDRGTAYHISFSLPDGSAQGTELMLEGRVLTILVTSPNYSHRPSVSGRYNRQIMLPGPVAAASDAHAFVTNGLLYVVVPKGPGSDRAVRPVRVF